MKVAYLKECLKEYFKKFLLSRWQQKKNLPHLGGDFFNSPLITSHSQIPRTALHLDSFSGYSNIDFCLDID